MNTKKNFIKANRAVIAWLSIFVVFIVSVLLLGYLINGQQYDAVVTGSKVGDLNYMTGTGTQNSVTNSSIDGLIKPKVTDANTEEVLGDASLWTTAEANNTREAINYYNTSFTVLNAGVSSNFTYDATEADLETTNDPTLNKTWDDYVLAMAKSVYASSDNMTFRVYLKDDAYWSQSGNVVKTSDFVSAWKLILFSPNGASTRYMWTSYSHIIGTNELTAIPQYDDSKTPAENDVIQTNAAKVQWEEINDIFWNVDANPTTTPPSEAGIWYSNENNYIQFNLYEQTQHLGAMLSNAAFWPIDTEWAIDTWGDFTHTDYDIAQPAQEKIARDFGTKAKYISSNGAYTISSFDAAYGIEYQKNPNYWATNGEGPNGDNEIDFVTMETFLYRTVTEPATQVTLFETGYSSYATSTDSTVALLEENEATSPYIQDNLTSPTTRLFLFNLDPNLESNESWRTVSSDNSKYYKNTNFRRAMSYSYNRNSYLDFSGYANTYPSQLITPANLFKTDNGGITDTKDFIDFATGYEFQVPTSASNTVGTSLNYYTYEERLAALQMTEAEFEATNPTDKQKNDDVAQYYWGEFQTDMEQLGIYGTPDAWDPNDPSSVEPDEADKISLDYVTSDASSDTMYQSFNESLDASGIPIKLIPRTQAGSSFWATFDNGDFDVMSLRWSPDYPLPWATQSILNNTDLARGANMSGGWTYWAGTSATISDNTYGSANTITAQEQQDDGLWNILEDANRYDQLFNPTDASATGLGSIYSDTTDSTLTFNQWVEDSYGTMSESDYNDYFNIVHDSNQTTNEIFVGGITYDQLPPESTSAMSKYALYFYTMTEVLARDGVPLIVVTTETKSSTPSRMLFYTEPSIGYPSAVFAYDVRKAPNGFPGIDALIGTGV